MQKQSKRDDEGYTIARGTMPTRNRCATGPSNAVYQNPLWKPSPEALNLWKTYAEERQKTDITSIQRAVCTHATKTLARSSFNMDDFAAYQAAAYSVRDYLIDHWNLTQQYHGSKDPKRVYYLSLEMKDSYKQALLGIGFRVEDIINEEVDAALGNGGLGRLAACFMDSLATLDYPVRYGIRYTYGIFQQRIIDGYQAEFPDYWLNFGNPWEIQRLDVSYDVRFHGYVNKTVDTQGHARYNWEGGDKVVAVAYDYPIPGFDTNNTINIRLWSSKPKKEFDFGLFNEGNYDKSVEEQKGAENITSVLYPNDNHMVGKVLRLKQQYFFVCATLKDIIRRFRKSLRPWSEFPDQVSIQLNGKQPSMVIAELMRLLIDEEGLSWDDAWDTTYSFTNHTVLPEALERWAVPLLQDLLPRHMMIIFDINLFFLQAVERKYPGDRERLRRMSIIEEGHPQYVRMAFLAVVGSHTVNGVAALHSNLIKSTIFKDFVEFYGDKKFTNVTNGITPRRWLHQANPKLSDLISEVLGGSGWIKDLAQLTRLKAHADDPTFQKRWMDIKYQNKARLADYISKHCGTTVSVDALFDVQCKRFHEYKRQFMNIMSVIYRYIQLQKMTPQEREKEVPRVVIFSGKSAPGYYVAKLMIKLINNAAEVINKDSATSKYLKLIFIPNYNVSLAELIIPASDISQHISTAGTEASGTSNMKFVLNGGIILGTVDGANIEIAEEVGDENIWLFGALADEVEDCRYDQTYHRIAMHPKLDAVCKNIRSGAYGDANIFDPLLNTLNHDYYLLSRDFGSYIDTQAQIDLAFKDKARWAKRSIMATAGMGKFSSDRSIQEYAEKIWRIAPLRPPSA
ncbi:glycosyl transferase [Polychytrium aggregatum]|uniref:glycosyl transferase n=1 Tax=Polychytrium aggregatum TaxID=110093 RepID=UPI0022FE67EE|nr:glycosyl transferase [Polychytrium aggregatum]KAI9202964.1 glycosyl transferase [Polychytrium aggregatum]